MAIEQMDTIRSDLQLLRLHGLLLEEWTQAPQHIATSTRRYWLFGSDEALTRMTLHALEHALLLMPYLQIVPRRLTVLATKSILHELLAIVAPVANHV